MRNLTSVICLLLALVGLSLPSGLLAQERPGPIGEMGYPIGPADDLFENDGNKQNSGSNIWGNVEVQPTIGGTITRVPVRPVEERCVISWHDSFQPHSAEVELRLDYQAGRQTWKKLFHCIKLEIYAPIDIDGIARRHVDACVQHGINDGKNIYLLKLIAGFAVDVMSEGLTRGGGAMLAIADYVDNVTEETAKCLTDSDRVGGVIEESVKGSFQHAVFEESSWEFWQP